MAASPSLPCPTRLGVFRQLGPQAELHRCTIERNINRLEKLLKKGVDVDSVNDLGQSPLYCACLVGLTSAAELLLQYGANPNHRCADWSTPVHAVAFSCNIRLLSTLLDMGGDLRLHDSKGRCPQDWATAGAQPNGAKMVEFLSSCMLQMQSLVQQRLPCETLFTPSSSKMLLRPPSLKDLLKPGRSDLCLNKKAKDKTSTWSSVQCFGFGKLCVEGRGKAVGALACIPLVCDVELTMPEDEPPTNYILTDNTQLTNLLWRGCRVTVKDSISHNASGVGRQNNCWDLLQREQDFCSRLLHPHLLQQLALAVDRDLNTRLVFERVHIGPLHAIIHYKREEVPLLPLESALSVLLQVCDALMYLHSRHLVLRSLSSHSVLLVRPNLAKLTGLGFISSCDGSVSSCGPPPPLPAALYNWASPEVIKGQYGTHTADIYSLCALLQEIYTDALPWGRSSPAEIRREVDEGRALAPHPVVPPPYQQLIQQGLQPRPQTRQLTLQQLRYTLATDIKELSNTGAAGCGALSPSSRKQQQPVTLNAERPGGPHSSLDEQIQDELRLLDRLLEEQGRNSTIHLREVRERSGQPERQVSQRIAEQGGTGRRSSKRLASSLRGVRAESGDDGESETEEKSTTSSFTEKWSDGISKEDDSDESMEMANHCQGTALTLDEWKSSLALGSPEETDHEGEAITSIMLNQQVCRVLLDKCENALETAELGGLSSSIHSHASARGYDEIDHQAMKRGPMGFGGLGGVVSGAVGPPLHYSPPAKVKGWLGTESLAGALWLGEFPSSPEASLTMCTATDRHTLSHTQAIDTSGSRELSRTYLSAGYSSSTMSADSEEERAPVPKPSVCPPQPCWSNQVPGLVSQMTWNVTPPLSSDTEEEYEERSRRNYTYERVQAAPSSQHDLKLEETLKNFAGGVSESDDEDEEFHTINRTTSGSEDSMGGVNPPTDRKKAPYTNQSSGSSKTNYMGMTAGGIEDLHRAHASEMDGSLEEETSAETTMNPSSEDEDLDVTVEVCRPSLATIDMEAREPPPVVCAPQKRLTDVRNLPDLATDFAEISSILGSPVPQQIPLGRRPCYSTPRSPQKSSCQMLQEPSAQAMPSLPNLVRTPDNTPSAEEEEETDSSDQSGFSTATSHGLASSRGVSRGCADDGAQEDAHSSSSPSPSEASRTESLAAFEEDEELMLAEVEQGEEKDSTDDDEEEEEEEEGDDNDEELTDDDFVSVDDSPEKGQMNDITTSGSGGSQPAEGMEETERASATLDEVLQGMLRQPCQECRSPGPHFHSRAVMGMEGEVDGAKPAGDRAGHFSAPLEQLETIEDPAKPNDKVDTGAYHDVWIHQHRVIILEHTPGKETPKKQ